MLEKLPGVASADADKTTKSATIVYDKSVFDTASIGDEGRYAFELLEDSAAGGGASATSGGSQAKEEMEDEKPSMIKIEDSPAAGSSSSSDDSDLMPSFD